MKLYLDIETSYSGQITVIGFYARGCGLVQLVHPDLGREELLAALPPASQLYTYNGHCFDLPVIRKAYGVDLRGVYESVDLRFACQRAGWKGGLKKVEAQLGITRELPGVDGWAAMGLWEQYWIENDRRALDTLLAYNREDVMNLVKVRRALQTSP